ncbi:MAG: cell wall hydrolase [Lachnospiraceae bacterium]|nr:cell wall hydrolase [Lachnospiraceae bacterium]
MTCKFKSLQRIVITIILIGMMTSMVLPDLSTSTVKAETIDELKDKTKNIQENINKSKDNIPKLQKQIEKIVKESKKLPGQIRQLEVKLSAAKLSESLQYDKLKKRIKFMYENGNTSFLEVLFESKSFAEFLSNSEYIQNISQYDRDMLNELKDTREKIEKATNNLKEKQEELKSKQKELKEKQAQLKKSIEASQQSLDKYNTELSQKLSALGMTNMVIDSAKMGVSVEDFTLFASILEAEAGIGGYNGMLAVATVILNRVESPRFPNTIREVIFAPGQFSPTWNGALNSILEKGPSITAQRVAEDALNGSRHADVRHCYFFWASFTGHPGINVGDNVFW